MSDKDGTAKNEAARQAVALVMMAVAVPVLGYLERKSTDPDWWPQLTARVRRFLNPPRPRSYRIDREVADFRRDLAEWDRGGG